MERISKIHPTQSPSWPKKSRKTNVAKVILPSQSLKIPVEIFLILISTKMDFTLYQVLDTENIHIIHP